jgi:glycosyltransferase involved in cell wall biosynthesis
MKLIIQIPCYNEEEHLPVTLAALPRKIAGVDVIEYLVIDDGSTDRTSEVARSLGVHHVVRGPHRGLARTFMVGLEASIHSGADIIVNTDADNQYCADDIEKLVAPIIAGKAELVVGARPIKMIKHFSPLKRMLQRLGSWAVRVASGTEVADAPSGFRAISRNAAMQLKVFTDYSYTLETIIQAGRKGIAVASVPIRTNEDLRPSRLVKSIASYVRRSLVTILRIFMTYRPMRFFLILGSIVFGAGFLLGARFLYFVAIGAGTGHVQSLILASMFMMIGFMTWVMGLLADIISVNLRLLEEANARLWKLEEAFREVLDSRPSK